MKQIRIPAVFMRGGTSNALVFHERDLPGDRALWGEIFLSALGSPDAYGRQLDGMGGGISSLSKVCVIGPSARADADIDYTFAQVMIKEAVVDYGMNCGNMSAAMGPFAVDEGLVKVAGDEALVRIYNTNTKKTIHARFPIDEGKAAVDGDLEIPGVSGVGAPVRLEFREPGGATTGKLLPTGNVVDILDVPGVGKIRTSLIDAANATCFLNAADLGLSGAEMPETLDSSKEILDKLARIRIAASLAMGIGKDAADAANRKAVPFIGFVSPPQDAPSLAGAPIKGDSVHLTARMLSAGQPHRALPLTVSLCLAVAARITGTIVNEVARLDPNPDAGIKIAMPSGVLTVAAIVNQVNGAWHAELGGFYRTARRLFDGQVYVRAARVPQFVPKGRDKTPSAA